MVLYIRFIRQVKELITGIERSCSYAYKASVQNDDGSPHNDIDDSPRSHRSHSRDCGAGYVGTTQEEQDRDAIRSAPENKTWRTSLTEQGGWYGYSTGSCRIPLFDSSRLNGLDVSAKNYRTEHEFYIDVWCRHRWFHVNYKQYKISLAQVWNAFITKF